MPPPPGYYPPAPGYYPPAPGYYPPPYPGYYYPPRPTQWGLVAGIMLIIGAVIAFIETGYIMFIVALIGSFGGFYDSGPAALLAMCVILPLLAGIFGIIGAMQSFRRERWTLALIGSILLIPGYSLVFGVLALVFLVVGKEEFRS
jgi:hypothetical protein